MGRRIAWMISLLLLTALSLAGQGTQSTQPGDSAGIQRVPPPAEDATPQDLEKQGDALRAQKAYMDSIDYYRAARKKGDSATLHNKIAISLFQLHRESEARKEYELAIKRDPTYAEAYNNLGALYYYNNRFGAAVRQYRKAIRLADQNATFHSNLGAAYFSEKDFEKAMKEYTRAMQLDPNIFDHQVSGGVSVRLVTSNDRGHLHYLMAQMYGSRGDQERCRYYLSKANEEGYPTRDALHDDQFAGLRKNPEFVTFVRSLKPPSDTNQ